MRIAYKLQKTLFSHCMSNALLYKILFLLVTLNFLFLSPITYAAIDKELIQSARCVGYFRHFETRLKIPKDTLYSISIQETGKAHSDKKVKISWPWTVNVEGKGYYFNSKHEAVQFVRDQMRAGKESIDVGCMQVNLKHHPNAFKSIEHAFDPRSNIAYGAKFLISKYEQLGSWAKAIAHYHSATPHLGEKYKDNIVKIAQNIDHYKSAFKRQPGAQMVKLAPRVPRPPQNIKYVATSQARPKAHILNKERKYKSNMMIYVPKSNRNDA